MPRIDVVVSCPVHDSFRVQQVAGMFDVPLTEKSSERFEVDIPDVDEHWQIGLIVGPSGSGKSTIARGAFRDGVVSRPRLARRPCRCRLLRRTIRATRRRLVHRRRLRFTAIVGQAIRGFK